MEAGEGQGRNYAQPNSNIFQRILQNISNWMLPLSYKSCQQNIRISDETKNQLDVLFRFLLQIEDLKLEKENWDVQVIKL